MKKLLLFLLLTGCATERSALEGTLHTRLRYYAVDGDTYEIDRCQEENSSDPAITAKAGIITVGGQATITRCTVNFRIHGVPGPADISTFRREIVYLWLEDSRRWDYVRTGLINEADGDEKQRKP